MHLFITNTVTNRHLYLAGMNYIRGNTPEKDHNMIVVYSKCSMTTVLGVYYIFYLVAGDTANFIF